MSDLLPIEWHHDHASCLATTHLPGLDCEGFPTTHDIADHMGQVLRVCWNEDSTSDTMRVVDMLADLLHFCDQRGVDIYAALLKAEDYFEAEAAPPPPDASRIEDTAAAPERPSKSVPGNCEACGRIYVSRGQHLRRHPECQS